MIEHSSTYAEVHINNASPFGFDIHTYYIRLAISHNSSVVVPNISQEIWNFRRGKLFWNF